MKVSCSVFSGSKDVLLPVTSPAVLKRCCEHISPESNPSNTNLFILFSTLPNVFLLAYENQGSLIAVVASSDQNVNRQVNIVRNSLTSFPITAFTVILVHLTCR